MSEWIVELLAQVLGDDMSEYTEYVLSIDNEVDFEEYMRNLLDFSNQTHVEVYENIKAAKFGNQKSSKKKTKSSNAISDNFKKTVKQESPPPAATSSDNGSKKRSSKKFIKFQLQELQNGYLKEGRIPCNCQATRHKLISNCLECGRIVCEQEGSGPCFFCESMVCTNDEMEVLDSGTKQAGALYNTLMDRKKSDAWRKAMQQRNKMLDFDKNCTQRTKIIDDEHDWYDTNNRWASKKEREKSAKKLAKDHEAKYGSRLGARTITLDLLGQQAIEEHMTVAESDESDTEAEEKIAYQSRIPDIESVLKSLSQMKPIAKPKKYGLVDEKQENQLDMMRNNYVIQDKMFLEMRDMGMCLSMHQPWASLLLTGIKKHEGRTWYTPHRGTLWIAAASKPVDPDTVTEVEKFYIEYYKGKRIEFPTDYPTGCLLGCVLVQDCLDQEEYRQEYPNGESDSPYVLICTNPQMLPVGYSMQGEHKIYKLKSQIHKMARDALIVRRRF